jgi:predicted NBD/HSP70 family sugar kinase
MQPSPGSLTGLRQGNRQRVLDVLRQHGTTSRPEIARQTGLSTTTVSDLVRVLLDEGVIVELAGRPEATTQCGRPATLLTYNPARGGAVGVHLAHDHVRLGLTDLAGNVLAERSAELNVDHEPAEALAYTAVTALDLIARAGLKPDAIAGLGVALSAPTSSATGAVAAGPILPDWRAIDVAGDLERRTGLHVEVGNDANLGAIAERRFGAAQGTDHFLYVMLSDGVGAGLFLGGRLYEGFTGRAGEFGHVTVVPNGYVCRCGNRGCLETIAGVRALTGALTLTRGARTTLRDVIDLAAAGDPGARRVLADAGSAIGAALAGICAVLDPALVVIGGETSQAGAALLDAARDALATAMTPLREHPVRVVAGTLGEQAQVLGAVTLVTQRMTLL